MNTSPTKAPRGRPKTLNRDRVLDTAMHAYWEEGINGLSVNEICKRCEISKPGLYREFGNEDGLMEAVHLAYQEQVLNPVLKMLTTEAPFREELDNLVSFITADDDSQEPPKGCLIAKMRESRLHVGEATRAQIDRTRERVLAAYEKWVDDAKNKGEFSADMPSEFVARYIDAQLTNAQSQLTLGEQRNDVKMILITAFSML